MRARAAWGLWLISVAAAIGAVVIAWWPGAISTGLPPAPIVIALTLAFATVGAVIASRRRHPIGWIFLCVAVGLPGGFFGELYAIHTLVTDPGSLPGVRLVLTITNLGPILAAGALSLTFLLFPTGRPPGPRWEPVRKAMLGGIAAVTLGWALRPGSFNGGFNDHGVQVVNPMGVRALETPLAIVFGAGVVILLAGAVLGIVSLFVRFRRGSAIERGQIKWLAFVGMVSALLWLSLFPAQAIGGDRAGETVFTVFFATLMLGTPAAVAIAILRYRLYDIDRIISRTLSYLVLTLVLAGAYVLMVFLPVAVIGSGRAPDWIVAIATLVVAALFRPVRRRVQNAVDHRFNRARYDAARTIDAFASRLRDELDMDSLQAELSTVVARTMQPAHLSVWVRT